MWVFYALVVLACLASIANCVLLFFLIVFMVNLRDKLKEFFSDLMEVVTVYESPAPVIVQHNKAKTWDEKFEEELEERERRMKMDSGLDDLPSPKVSFGEPPAANPQEGLTLRENKGNMRI